MTKRQMIDEIITMNTSADPGFLAEFNSDELSEYMNKLRLAIRTENQGPARKRQYSPFAHCRHDDGCFDPVEPSSQERSVATVALKGPELSECPSEVDLSEPPSDHPTLFDFS